MIDRRALLLMAALGLLVQPASADNVPIYRIAGEVTAKNFDAFAAFAMDSVDQFVGLKVSFPEGDKDNLIVEESDKLLLAYRRKGDVQLSFPSGYRAAYGKFHVEGYYRVKYEGMHQGINTVSLTPARSMDVEATGKPVKLVEIDQLPVKN